MLSYPVIWESNDLLWVQIECCDWSQPAPSNQATQISSWRNVWEEQTSQYKQSESGKYWREEKKIESLPREPFTRFSNIQVIKKSSDNEVGLFRSSAIFWSQVIKFIADNDYIPVILHDRHEQMECWIVLWN